MPTLHTKNSWTELTYFFYHFWLVWGHLPDLHLFSSGIFVQLTLLPVPELGKGWAQMVLAHGGCFAPRCHCQTYKSSPMLLGLIKGNNPYRLITNFNSNCESAASLLLFFVMLICTDGLGSLLLHFSFNRLPSKWTSASAMYLLMCKWVLYSNMCLPILMFCSLFWWIIEC